MLPSIDYVSQSLELHLFFARIMKEHSFFLEAGFTPQNSDYIQKADVYRNEFDELLRDVVKLSNGIVSASLLQSGEAFTQYTFSAENASANFTGVNIASDITIQEAKLASGNLTTVPLYLEQQVYFINQKANELVTGLIQFKESILANVLSCKIFTVNYPLLIDHIIREAKLYQQLILRLQNRVDMEIEAFALEQETFWNRIMAEHSKFIRGLLDPTENDLINLAENFGNQFDQLTEEAKQAMDKTISLTQVTEHSLQTTTKIRDFKAQGTKGILDCKVKSIIIPLLGDHVLREANHYLRLLRLYSK